MSCVHATQRRGEVFGAHILDGVVGFDACESGAAARLQTTGAIQKEQAAARGLCGAKGETSRHNSIAIHHRRIDPRDIAWSDIRSAPEVEFVGATKHEAKSNKRVQRRTPGARGMRGETQR